MQRESDLDWIPGYHDFWILQDLELLPVLSSAILQLNRACLEDGEESILAGKMNPWDGNDAVIGNSSIRKFQQ